MAWIGIAQDLVADGLVPTPSDAALGLPTPSVGQPGAANQTSRLAAGSPVGKMPTSAPRGDTDAASSQGLGRRIALALGAGFVVIVAGVLSSGSKPRSSASFPVHEAPLPAVNPTAAPPLASPRPAAPVRDRAVVRHRKASRPSSLGKSAAEADDGAAPTAAGSSAAPVPSEPAPSPTPAPSQPVPVKTLDLQQIRDFERNL